MRIGHEEHAIAAGFSVCFPPGLHHVRAWHRPESPLRVFFCHFDVSPVAGSDAPGLPRTPSVKVLTLSSLVHALVGHWSRTGFNGDASALQSVLLWQMLLLHEDEPQPPKGDAEDRIRSLIAEIRENPAGPYEIEELARRTALSTGHFRRVFRELTGVPPIRFIIGNRINRARYYLAETRLPVSHIASTVGYTDIYYFSRHFKERTGQSPTAWRRQHAQRRRPTH